MTTVKINWTRLVNRINTLGNIEVDPEGHRTRLAADDADKVGRDLLCDRMRQAGLSVVTDYIGNIFGIWETEENQNRS